MTELEKPHIKTKADPGGLYKWYLLVIQEADHLNFTHSLSDNIGKMGRFYNSSILSWYPKKKTTTGERKTEVHFTLAYRCESAQQNINTLNLPEF